MLFNSFEFLFLFLPITLLGYFVINHFQHYRLGKAWLILASVFFYSFWNITFLPIILFSLGVNYTIGKILLNKREKWLLTIGITFNICVLGYFKYWDFFIYNVNHLFGTTYPIAHIVLPLAISFFTFQKIAFLMEIYRGETTSFHFFDYMLFVLFFPQLIAGPIVLQQEIMPQFADNTKKRLNTKNITTGIFIFALGLFKKIGIADVLAPLVHQGFDQQQSLTFVESWITSLTYTFQLYFDFSGYCDMALGIALMFNIKLPINFRSPYKATNIQDFWRCWHITLGRFLTNYLYIPLGGSRGGTVRTCINILIIFAVSGLWHGAGWTFVIWGLLHGIASVIYRLWSKRGYQMPAWAGWLVTFLFVNAAWVFFRAKTWVDAVKVLKGMIGLNGFTVGHGFSAWMSGVRMPLWNKEMLLYVLIALLICFFFRNSMEWKESFRPNFVTVISVSALFVYCILHLNNISEFLYFNF